MRSGQPFPLSHLERQPFGLGLGAKADALKEFKKFSQ
jgi:hypothetical protein